jgi:cell wall-active antibiotic response 4TMS protein YvqF
MAAPRMELTPHTFIGVSLALLGVVLTLDNLGFVNAGDVLKFWPLVPMLVGLAYVAQAQEARDWLLGAGWLSVGTAFLLRNLGVFHFRLTDFLPLVLVAVGLKFILGRSRRKGPPPSDVHAIPGVPPVPPAPDAGASHARFHGPFPGGAWYPGWGPFEGAANGTGVPVRVFAFFWGADRRVRGPMSHAEVSAVMGGCDLDLRDAVPTSDPVIVQVFAMWGGIDVRVPPDWLVQNEAWPILGGVVDNTQTPMQPTRRVILRGMAFMGGVEIRN